MATRQTRLIIKNSPFPSQTLPSSGVLAGEALVNLGDGIMFFTGGTSGSPTWVDSGNATSGYFEVGSNLYQLKIRDKITTYSGVTNLTGKFLSGTSSGFVLSDITNIQGVDRYVTGGTLTTSASTSSNLQTTQLSYNITPSGGPFTISTQNTFTTGGTYSNSTKLITFLRNDGVTGYTVDLTNIDTNDTYVTGGTNTAATTSSPNASIGLLYNQDIAPGTYTLPYTNVFTTGFTYDSSNNTFSIKDNSGNTYSDSINVVSGLSLSNLTSGRVVYVGSNGLLKDEAGFTYTEGLNTLGVQNIEATGDVTVQGSLTVFGPSVSAFTSNLYVEDNNITLNYNPTGSTTLTSVGAGWTIQDGSGISNTATTLNIGVSYLNSNLSPNTEYTSSTGNENRNFFTQLGDIIIRNTNYNSSSPNGVRVLAEGDILDGGSF
jgi:hypothetical protein